MQDTDMSNGRSQLTAQLNDELTKAYLGGLFDAAGTITARVKKDDSYKFEHTISAEISLRRSLPQAVKILDDFCLEHGVNGNVNQYDGSFEWKTTRISDVSRLLEMLRPYIREREKAIEILTADILPTLEAGSHRESQETFMNMMGAIERLREADPNARDSKYDVEYFEDLFADSE